MNSTKTAASTNTTKEIWKAHPEWSHIFTSTRGRTGRMVDGEVVAYYAAKHPAYKYPMLMMKKNLTDKRNQRRMIPVHKLVMETWNGPRPDSTFVIAFKDNDRHNTAPSNLHYTTRSQAQMGHSATRLTVTQQKKIIGMWLSGSYTKGKLARIFKRNTTCIGALVRRYNSKQGLWKPKVAA